MPVYATTVQLQDFIGATRALPLDAERLIVRASELIEYATLSRIDTDDTEDAEVAQKATCAQVEFWMETDESHAILAPEGGSRTQIGSLVIQNPNQLSPRARMILATAGLMYRGVRPQIRQRATLADSFFDPQLNPNRRV